MQNKVQHVFLSCMAIKCPAFCFEEACWTLIYIERNPYIYIYAFGTDDLDGLEARGKKNARENNPSNLPAQLTVTVLSVLTCFD